MGIEIERKFLVDHSTLPNLGDGMYISQGYIDTSSHTIVRARVKGQKGYLTIKGENTGMSCLEYEYEIPATEAREIISTLCNGKSIEKTRYEVKHAEHIWEIDFFHGANDGLIVAEVELSDEKEHVVIPDWASKEVTGQAKYFNASLIKAPYIDWQ